MNPLGLLALAFVFGGGGAAVDAKGWLVGDDALVVQATDKSILVVSAGFGFAANVGNPAILLRYGDEQTPVAFWQKVLKMQVPSSAPNVHVKQAGGGFIAYMPNGTLVIVKDKTAFRVSKDRTHFETLFAGNLAQAGAAWSAIQPFV